MILGIFNNNCLVYCYLIFYKINRFFNTFMYFSKGFIEKEQINFIENERSKVDINQQAEQILEDYGNNILRLAYSYLHNMSDAEDVLQDTLIQFLKKAPMFNNKHHEKAWVLRVASNISKNKIKYNKVRKADELNETLVAEESNNLTFVWEAVKSLPEKYREVIHLYYYEGYQIKQIASILNKNDITVRSNLHRGRILLKNILKEDYDFEKGL